MQIRKKFFIIFALFIVVYYPSVNNIKSLSVISVLAYVYLIFNFIHIKKYVYNSKIKNIISYLLFILIYLFIVSSIIQKQNIMIYTYILIIFQLLPVCIFLSYYLSVRNYSFDKVIFMLIITANIQGLIAIISLLNTTFNQFLFSILYTNSIVSNTIERLASFRMYGLSSNLVYSMPFVQGIITVLAIYYGIKINKKYLFLGILPFISGIINARSTLIVVAIGMLFILSTRKNLLDLVKNLILIFLLFLIVYYIYIYLNNVAPDTFNWINDGINEIINFLRGNKIGYFAYVTSQDKYILPKDMGVLIGKGIQIMQSETAYISSDIGFVNDIWKGGVIYAGLGYSLIVYMCIIINKNIKHKEKLLGWFLMITFFVMNIKGMALGDNCVTHLLFFLFVFVEIQSSKEKSTPTDFEK